MSAGLVLAGRYRLTKQLGAGGMGAVWRAEDMNLGAEVAVKLIDSAFAYSPEALARFRREARAAAAIRSTYVVQILDYGIDNGTPFIAMELLKGESLAQRLESVGKLIAEQTGHILGHVGRALALAHENGIVHRDMKPENVFLVREGNEDVGKVLDFGIARQSGGLADSGGLKTQTGSILGTPFYMSSEQATGQPVDHQSDIWSYGVIAFECLVGRKAFEGESLGGLFHAICMAPLPTPSRVANVPPRFDAWFARAVARDKGERFSSITQAAEELRLVCGCASGRASAVSLAGHRTDGAVAALTAPEPSTTLGYTAAPSSRTTPGLPKKTSRLPWIALGGFVLVGAGTTLGWRALMEDHRGVASAIPISSAVPSVAKAEPVLAASPSATAAPSAFPVTSESAPSVLPVEVAPVAPNVPRKAVKPRGIALKPAEHTAPAVAEKPPVVAAEPTPRMRNAAGL